MAIKGITKDGSLVELGSPGILAQIDTEEGDEKFRQSAIDGLVATYADTREGAKPNDVAPEAMRAPLGVVTSSGPNDLGKEDKPIEAAEAKAFDIEEGSLIPESGTPIVRRGRPPVSKSDADA